MNCDPRSPVLVGAGQLLQRVEDPAAAREPLALMIEAAERAAKDAAAPGLLGALDSIRIPRGVWDYANPAALLRERFGVPRAETGLAPVSGTMVQHMITDAALQIAAGKRDVVLVVGAEAERSKRRARRQGRDLQWTPQSGPEPDNAFASTHREVTRHEVEMGLRQPAAIFSLYENAMRAARGESLEAHRERISELWARFARVAAGNPYAWTRSAPSAEEIRTASPSNKMNAWPYTKLLCANMVVDQAAAVILCSAEAAERHGVPRDRWVFPQAVAETTRSPLLSNRLDFSSHAGMQLAADRIFTLAGTGPEALAHVDLYSCFPAAVQLGAELLGLPPERPLTVTGGLSFGGGPFNSYVLHSTATMMQRLREEPGSLGLVSGVGGWFTKNVFAIHSTRPPPSGFRHESLDDELTKHPIRECADFFHDTATTEIYTLTYLEGQPVASTVACRIADGRRVWAASEDPEFHRSLLDGEPCGRPLTIRGNAIEAWE
jgi:acetyl-CoA C-acetyltransferase